jgi:hypothetical protein
VQTQLAVCVPERAAPRNPSPRSIARARDSGTQGYGTLPYRNPETPKPIKPVLSTDMVGLVGGRRVPGRVVGREYVHPPSRQLGKRDRGHLESSRSARGAVFCCYVLVQLLFSSSPLPLSRGRGENEKLEGRKGFGYPPARGVPGRRNTDVCPSIPGLLDWVPWHKTHTTSSTG